MRRAFTLVEMLVAVILLVAIIFASGKIFSSARQVASLGEASADVLQQAAVLREQLQRDLERISRDGYFAIQCVAVRNDINRAWSPSAPLLNPLLGADAIVRCEGDPDGQIVIEITPDVVIAKLQVVVLAKITRVDEAGFLLLQRLPGIEAQVVGGCRLAVHRNLRKSQTTRIVRFR